MKRSLFGIAVFLLTLYFGYVVVTDFRKQSVERSDVVFDAPNTKTVVPSPPTSVESPSQTQPEFTDLPNYEDVAFSEPSKNLIDVYENGNLYRESEVVAKSGEAWLVLTKREGKYSFIKAKATVTRKGTYSFAGDEPDVQLKFDKPGVPIIAVRNIKSLRPGPVSTLYHRPSYDELDRQNRSIDPMGTGYRQAFVLNDRTYVLRVSNGLHRDGTPENVLVLENGGITQIVAQNYDEIGNLLWVGDMDNDGKLDLYFDEANEKGGFYVGLYLSSEADPGKLLKRVALFEVAGC